MKTLLGSIIAVALIVVGIGAYLGPDDLAGCDIAPTLKDPCQAADAIVAVSGGDTTARTQEAVRLYKSGWAPKLIFSGAAQDKTGPSNAEAMRREARASGVPDEAIITEELSATTYQNAKNTQAIVRNNNLTSVILVTSAYHQRRAGLEFRKRSGDSVTVRNHPIKNDDQWSGLWWLTPTGWFLAISELVKIVAFYLGGSR